MKDKKKFLYLLFGIFGIIFLKNIDLWQVYEGMKALKTSYIILLLALQTLTICLINIQWNIISRKKTRKSNLYEISMVNFKGNILDGITPGVKLGGELARAVELKNRLDIPIEDTKDIIIIQKVFSISGLIILSFLSILWLFFLGGDLYELVARFRFYILGFYLIALGLFFYVLKSKKILKEDFKISKIFTSSLDLGLNIIISIAIWGIFPVKMKVLSLGFNESINFISLCGITYITYVMGMIPILPGGMGTFEGSMILLLSSQGIGAEKGLLMTLVFRGVTFWYEFLLSIIVVFCEKIYIRGGVLNGKIKRKEKSTSQYDNLH